MLQQEYCELTHHIKHIVPKKHNGSSSPGNLALACHRCNLLKGLAGTFHDAGCARVEGITSVGRATVQVLAMNDIRRVELRAELLKTG